VIEKWEGMEVKALRLRKGDKNAMSIFDVTTVKGMFSRTKIILILTVPIAPGKAKKQLELTEKEISGASVVHGSASWLSIGIKIQEQQ
jgi:hypothetical protein